VEPAGIGWAGARRRAGPVRQGGPRAGPARQGGQPAGAKQRAARGQPAGLARAAGQRVEPAGEPAEHPKQVAGDEASTANTLGAMGISMPPVGTRAPKSYACYRSDPGTLSPFWPRFRRTEAVRPGPTHGADRNSLLALSPEGARPSRCPRSPGVLTDVMNRQPSAQGSGYVSRFGSSSRVRMRSLSYTFRSIENSLRVSSVT
jgi:hypothetical protein